MKHTCAVLFLAVLVLTAKGQSFEAGWWQTFEGRLGAAPIQLSLYNVQGTELKGNYCYTSIEAKRSLQGNIVNGQVTLTEMQNGIISGYFTGRLSKQDSLTGTWTDSARSRPVNFRLHLAWASAARDAAHRYANLRETDTQVETFMAQAKAAIIGGNKAWLAERIHYPIVVTINRKRTAIKNKEQFLRNFDRIIPQAYKNRVKAACACNLFSNAQGVMLGNGEVWIDDLVGGDGKTRLYIKAINNG